MPWKYDHPNPRPKKLVVTLDGEERTSGVTSSISWMALARHLNETGFMNEDEQIVQFELTEDAIKFVYEKV